ncbi:MAG: DNA polymerase III subunit gamma/tau [Oscillospiraceae bacterium]|nr:DNA polymerase III subunit gamma/tau [Oscillospiraceae bacterium]
MYQALYRKWRPRAFDDVIGQDHITETLKRQVSSNRLSHAYLFVGTRGTGKTTCAKILSRAVNCENPIDGNPCNKCPSCLGIESGAILDVVELDAASNNGVDSVRALRDEAVYSPASVRKRVYIVDEVHMLSTSAFNALLKILEEPPEHLMFILATTELHKVPATILSRCQRFSFKRILPTDIAKRMKYVASQENINLTDDGAELLSRLADGAMRDALSLLDQCGSEGTIDAQRVISAIGLAGNEDTKKLFTAARKGDVAAALSTVDTLYRNGKDMNAVVDELLSLTRDILIFMLSPENCGGLISGVFDTDSIKMLAKGLSPSQVMNWLEILKNTQIEMAEVSSGRIAVELCLLRMCDVNLSNDASSLAARIGAIEKRLESGDFAAPAVTVQIAEPAPQPKDEEPPFYDEFDTPPWDEEPPPPIEEHYDAPPWDDDPIAPTPVREPEPVKEVVPPPKPVESAPVKVSAPASSGSWDAILDGAQADIDMPLFFMLNDKSEVRGVVSGDTLVVKCKNPFTVTIADTPEVIAALKKSAANVLGRNVAVKLADDDGSEEVAEDKLDALSRFDIISFE